MTLKTLPLPLPAFGSSFLTHYRQDRNLSENTLSAYAQDLREFVRFVGAEVELTDLSGTQITEYRRHLGNRNAAPATIRRRLACLRALSKWLVRQKLVTASPFDGLDLTVRVPKRLPRSLSPTEVGMMLSTARMPDEHRFIVSLLVETGMRVGELASVRTDWIDPVGGVIRIVGKGDRERSVYVTDSSLLAMLAQRVAGSDVACTTPLLRHRSGASMAPAAIRRRVIAAARQSGLARRVTPHMLRHTAATLLMERGVDIRVVQRLLGHQSILTTQAYVNVRDGVLRDAVARAGVLSFVTENRAP